jgi:hypothetical protein
MARRNSQAYYAIALRIIYNMAKIPLSWCILKIKKYILPFENALA